MEAALEKSKEESTSLEHELGNLICFELVFSITNQLFSLGIKTPKTGEHKYPAIFGV